MRAASALLVVFGFSVAVDALTREQAKENKLCRKVKKRKNKYVAAKEKYEEKYEKSCEEGSLAIRPLPSVSCSALN